jgi:cell division protein FtsI/penicillin-binding protein 2
MTMRRGLYGRTFVATLVLPLAVACSTTPDPADEAALLATDLADGTLDTATLTGAPADPDAALATLLGNLADLPRTVTTGEPTEADDGTTTTVPLTWVWDLGGDEWGVETTATLELVEGEWVTRWSPTLVHPDAVDASTLRLTSEPAARGDVLSQDGTAIVTDRPVYRIGIDKAHIDPPEQAEAAARELATRLEFDDVAGFVARVGEAGPRAYVVAITVRAEEAERWDIEGLRKVPGVLVQSDEIPLAPTATFARPLLGTVGEATAEIVEESGGAIRAGDGVGLSGLQRAFDERLRGTPGTTVTLVTGEAEVELHATEPVDGTDLVLTLEEPYQVQAEGLLADIESASAIVAVRPSDGTILAAASGPGGGGLNTATVGLYAPGSTFKIATTLALLRAGLTADTPVPCSPTVTVDGREFENFPGYPAASLGDIPLREAIAQSCNTALIAQHEAVTAADVAAAAAALGIGTPGTWPFPYATGSVPADATGTSHAASLIGQGDVLASPLAMAVAAASVAAGETVTPVLVVGEEADAVAPSTPLTAAEAGVLAELMRGVVETGTSTFLLDVPGDPVAAKSGTAQWGSGEQVHAWMIAFRGDLAVAVFVEDGEYGTATAGPLLEAFLRNVP